MFKVSLPGFRLFFPITASLLSVRMGKQASRKPDGKYSQGLRHLGSFTYTLETVIRGAHG